MTAAVFAGQAPSPAQLTQVDHGRTTAAAPAALPAAGVPAQKITVPVTLPSLPDQISVPIAVPAPPVTVPGTADLPALPLKLPQLQKIL